MCLVRISEQTATFALHSISRLVLYNRWKVFTARYELTRLVFKGLSHLLSELFVRIMHSNITI